MTCESIIPGCVILSDLITSKSLKMLIEDGRNDFVEQPIGMAAGRRSRIADRTDDEARFLPGPSSPFYAQRGN
jgi:hypothetical protein